MRIYQIDGTTCFDTDDLSEARLLDAYAIGQFQAGIESAARVIADWLEGLREDPSGISTLTDTAHVAQRIRAGEWRDF